MAGLGDYFSGGGSYADDINRLQNEKASVLDENTWQRDNSFNSLVDIKNLVNNASPLVIRRAAGEIGINLNAGSLSRYLGVDASGNLRFGSDASHGNNATVWTSANGGAGSGLDADTIDGIQGTALVNTSSDQSIDGNKTFAQNVTLSGNIVASSGNTTFEIINSAGDAALRVTSSITELRTPRSTYSQENNDSALTRKDYVDGLDGENVKTSGGQSISGTKTFRGNLDLANLVPLRVDFTDDGGSYRDTGEIFKATSGNDGVLEIGTTKANAVFFTMDSFRYRGNVNIDNELTVSGSRIPKTTVSSTAPSNPTTGDIWIEV